MTRKPADHGDPPPEPPERPLPSDCCESGCDPCIHEQYQDALEHYRRQLECWRARHPEVRGGSDHT